MRIGLIGSGAIASFVKAHIDADPKLTVAGSIVRTPRPGGVLSASKLGPVDLLVDCAGHAGLAAHGPVALSSGVSVVTLSLGALADDGLYGSLQSAAENGQSKLHLASGAIGALDALRAARVGGLRRVRYTGRKPPEGWRGSPAEKLLDLSQPLVNATTHFEGSARDAALQYPKNANVAAAVALAGVGFDDTATRLIADPNAVGNTHEITAEGTFGVLSFSLTGNSLPDNPKSSALAAMAAVASIRQANALVSFL